MIINHGEKEEECEGSEKGSTGDEDEIAEVEILAATLLLLLVVVVGFIGIDIAAVAVVVPSSIPGLAL